MTYHGHKNLFSYLSLLFFFRCHSLVLLYSIFFFTYIYLFFNPSFHLLLFQAAQLAHVLDDRLKVMLEEVDKGKALKQVAESNLSEKVAVLTTAEQRLASVERSRGLFEQTADEL